MSLLASRLKGNMKIAVVAALARYNSVDDNEELAGYTLDAFWDDICEAIAATVVAEITGNAACNGTDSNGDTHNTVGIV